MAKKVGIFTTNSVDKIHPRIVMQAEILRDEGFDVEIIRSKTKREGLFNEILNWFSLKYFKKGFIRKNKRVVGNYDVVHIYDFQLLPLAKEAKKKGRKVIYETLDDNVHLHFYALSKKLPFLSIFKSVIINKKARYERTAAATYCDHVIVNSANLKDNFSESTLIYYASPLESLSVDQFDSDKETAFIYIGKLTKAKGAEVYSSLVDQYNIPTLFLGKAFDDASREFCDKDLVRYLGNFDSSALKLELKELLASYNLIGLSIILPENRSYELQEANKDIDYMAVGIPFLGNKRQPTYKKIEAGAGVLFNDNERVKALINNTNGLYDRCIEDCHKIYKDFNKETFRKKLLEIYK